MGEKKASRASVDAVLVQRVDEILASAADRDGALITVVGAIHDSADHYDWTGIYLKEGEELILHNYLGAPTPHSRIPLGVGICGAAAAQDRTVLVPDVGKDDRYLACSTQTRSEIVVPISKLGYVFGEIDIDSHTQDAFDDRDRNTLERIARHLTVLFG